MASKPIRLAVVRCDIHAYWFAPFLVRTDPLRLREGNSFVHRLQTYPERPEEFIIRRVGGFQFASAWDADRAEADRFAATFADRPRVCATVEEAADGVDAALIANCSFDGSDHLELARPFLKRGLPIFIDKPFAATQRDARGIVRLAEKHEAPLMAASLLHYAEPVAHFAARRGELGRVGIGMVHGSHGWETKEGLEGVTHGIALALATFGGDVLAVECAGRLPLQFIILHYPDGRQVLINNMEQDSWPGYFSVEAWGDRHIRGGPIGDAENLAAGTRMLRAFRKMVQTRRPPVPYADILEWTLIAEAARRAQREHRRVTLAGTR